MLDTTATPTEMLKWLSERNHHIPAADLAYLLGIHVSGAECNAPDEPFDFNDDDYGDYSMAAGSL